MRCVFCCYHVVLDLIERSEGMAFRELNMAVSLVVLLEL